MRRELLVPKLGLTMTEGALVEWMVQPGDAFAMGQGLFVIESEKAANEIAAEADGTLLECIAQIGEILPCGTVIGYWDDGLADSAASASEPAISRASAGGAEALLPSREVSREEGGSAPASVQKAGNPADRVPVTPLARRLAATQGVDLSAVMGSGPRGRIRARDIEQHVAQRGLATLRPKASVEPAAARLSSSGTWRAPTSLERAVAQRLTLAKQQVPHFYLSLEAEVSELMALRSRMNAAQQRRKFTLNHWVLAAVGQALEAMPEVNRVWSDDGILNIDESDVGLAVHTEKGLLVPILRRVGSLSLGALALESGELIARAQSGRLSSADMTGGAITVSNAGMHDVTYLTSIINPGQSMILGVGSIREVFRPDANGQPVIRREMGLVLSADHRVLDGVSGLKFLKRIVQGLQSPAGLLAV